MAAFGSKMPDVNTNRSKGKIMIKKLSLVLLAVAMTTSAFASATRIQTVDQWKSSDLSKTWNPPAASDTIIGRDSTDTLTNKSLSGSSNTFTSIPASAVSSGQVSVSNGGTGDSTLTLNGMLFGNGTSAVGITGAGSQYQVFQAGASGIPAVGALHLDQSAAITGTLPVGNGGTGQSALTSGSVLVGNGSSAVSLVAPGSSGNVLQSNGSTWVSGTSPGAPPSLNGSTGSPQSVTAAGGVSLSSITYSNLAIVQGSPSAVTVTATPSITAGSAVGQRLLVIGTDNTKTVTLQDEAGLASSGLQLNGAWVGANHSVLELVWDGSFWVEVARK